jgi:hypothetical protein
MATACGGAQQGARAGGLLAADEGAYPFTLLPPASLARDFMVRQSLSVSVLRDGKREGGKFDAVLQKRGDTLLVLGLGPMSTRAFSIEYRGGAIQFEQKFGPRLPIAPRAILVDVERVYLAHLPTPVEGFTGRLTGTLGGELVTEDWAAGTLMKRWFERPDRFKEPLTIELGAGYTTALADPHRIVLHNPWVGYDVTITSDGAEAIE